jgi:NAD(P)-dependent dehydrogenase (short-subunit alcohol dehydrogenase family)
MRFAENVVVLTGASSGIGRALALALAGEGAWLVLAARNAAALEEVAAACRARGGRATVRPTDVAEPAQCRALIDAAVADYGRIDTLVNNAGISMWARFAEIQDLTIFERLMRVNYLGAVHLTWHALPHLTRSRGRIVAVSSVAGKTGVPTRTGYAASKHALVGFFDTLRIELAGTGVSVTIVSPDFVTSAIRERAFGADGQPLGEGHSPVHETEVMSAEACARLALRGIAGREREVLMSARSRLGPWLKLVAPGLVDRIARRAIARGR